VTVVAPVLPAPRRPTGRPTVATIQHGLLAEQPYVYRQSDVLLRTHAIKRGIDVDALPDGGASLRAELFARPQACLRASPLGKKHGWGIHFDRDGRAALVGSGTATYDRARRRCRRHAGGPGDALRPRLSGASPLRRSVRADLLPGRATRSVARTQRSAARTVPCGRP
jgi:hypothetical protein